MHTCFLPGIDVLAGAKRKWIKGRRIGLVSHPAAISSNGAPAAEVLLNAGARIIALFGPEHGFFGTETAGEKIGDNVHPQWRVPIYSLYGATRRPSADMLHGLDAIVFDLQDLGARCYTFVSTLRHVLEAAALAQKQVIVADRPIPLPRIVDGPMLDGRFSSFVGCIPAPLHYGMTPGETAAWLKHSLALDLDLKTAPMKNYRRQAGRGADWPPWIPPSQGIRSWETGYCYLATVCAEALPAIDIGRNSNLAFQVFSAPGIKSGAFCNCLNRQDLPGVNFYPYPYKITGENKIYDGVRIAVHDPDRFLPVTTGVAIIAAAQKIGGFDLLWRQTGTREDFFDKLYGTDQVRLDLQAGKPVKAIICGWQAAIRAFRSNRGPFLLYKRH